MVDAPVSTLPEQKEAPQVEEVKKTEPTDEEEAESPQDEKLVAAPVMMSANEVPMDEPSEPEISETDADTKTDSIINWLKKVLTVLKRGLSVMISTISVIYLFLTFMDAYLA